jgi:hypothetical protein
VTRKVKAAKRSEGGRAVQGGRAASAARSAHNDAPTWLRFPVSEEVRRLLVEIVVLDAEQDAAPSLEDMARRAVSALRDGPHGNICEKCEVMDRSVARDGDGHYLCPRCRWGCVGIFKKFPEPARARTEGGRP